MNDEQRWMWPLASRFVAFEPDVLHSAFITVHLSKDAARLPSVAQVAVDKPARNAKLPCVGIKLAKFKLEETVK